jgi:hypothetical protein
VPRHYPSAPRGAADSPFRQLPYKGVNAVMPEAIAESQPRHDGAWRGRPVPTRRMTTASGATPLRPGLEFQDFEGGEWAGKVQRARRGGHGGKGSLALQALTLISRSC